MKERILQFIGYKNINIAKFLQETGIKRGFLDADKLNVSVSGENIAKIVAIYPELNVEWLLSGQGDMVKGKRNDEAKLIKSPDFLYVPLVSQYAYAGYLNGFGEEDYIESLPTIPFIVDHEGRGNYIAFEVRGDSMDDDSKDAITEGDRLLCREIPKHLWAQSKLHIRKWDFVIVHQTEGIIVKRIIQHDVEKGIITIHSLNPLYPDREINLSEVAQIFNVVEVARRRRQ